MRDYTFTIVKQLGDPAPCGRDLELTFDFEVNTINNNQQLTFGADLNLPAGGEGAFLARISPPDRVDALACTGDIAPGGQGRDVFATLLLGRIGLNDPGDAAFGFTLDQVDPDHPGLGGSVFRFSHETHRVTRLFEPGVTPAPGGDGTLAGAFFNVAINNPGNLVFNGYIAKPRALLLGIFEADAQGRITAVVRPDRDRIEGMKIDFARNPFINDLNDVAFDAKLVNDPCVLIFHPPGTPTPPPPRCATSVFAKEGETIVTIARQGGPIPAAAGGGRFHFAFGPNINIHREIVFAGAVPAQRGEGRFGGDNIGIFVSSKGTIRKVAREGDSMPGGGHFVSGSSVATNYYINDNGDVAFDAALDTFDAALQTREQGVYATANGVLKLVAKTGTEIPGAGRILDFDFFGGFVGDLPTAGVALNKLGQVLFAARLEGSSPAGNRGVLVVATPR